jgi:hypothetical protein
MRIKKIKEIKKYLNLLKIKIKLKPKKLLKIIKMK